jgi:hypothetical protein
MRKLVTGVAGVLLAFALLPMQSAQGAAGTEQIFSDHFDVVDPIADCGSFVVLDHAVADITGTLYFDSQGNPYRLRVRINGTDNLSNSNGGPTYSSPNVLTYTEDYRQDRAWKTGVAFGTTVPGYGRVFTEVGLIKFDAEGIHFYGLHDTVNWDVERLCAALA